MDVWASIAAERLRLADLLESLTDEAWQVQSLCGAWTVRDVAAHLVLPISTPPVLLMPRFALDMALAWGRFDRANQLAVARLAARPTADLVAGLRRHAESRFVAPTMPRTASLAEVLVHGQDIRIPLDVDDPGPTEAWTTALDFLLTPAARRGFVPRPLPALRWVATDVDWSGASADGVAAAPPPSASDSVSPSRAPQVHGPAFALAMAAMGRPVVLERLDGDGVSDLRRWLDR